MLRNAFTVYAKRFKQSKHEDKDKHVYFSSKTKVHDHGNTSNMTGRLKYMDIQEETDVSLYRHHQRQKYLKC